MGAIAINPVERFHAKVSIVPITGCWMWTGTLTSIGYPLLWVRGKPVCAHRFSYELLTGRRLTKGLVLDHLCRHSWCVNPQHLQEVTQRENVRRGSGIAAFYMRSDQCPLGHPLKQGSTQRRCSTCRNAWQRSYRSGRLSQRIQPMAVTKQAAWLAPGV